MATFNDGTITYTGRDAAGFYASAILGGNTASVVEQYLNVKNSVKIASLDITGFLQDASTNCSWNPQSTTDIAQKSIDTCGYKFNVSYCQDLWEPLYVSQDLKNGFNNDALPTGVNDFLLNRLQERLTSEVERLFWQSDTTNSPADACEGMIQQLGDDSSVLPVSGTTLSAGNIIAELQKVYDKIPAVVKASGKATIFLAPTAAYFYVSALAALGNPFASYQAGDFTMKFLGVPLKITEGLESTPNVMVASAPKNLAIAVDLLSDFQDIVVLPQFNVSGAREIRIAGGFRMGVGYKVSEEIVLYS